MYYDIGNHVHVTCDKQHYDGIITHIVVKDVDERLETMIFLCEQPSEQQTFGNACIFVSQITEIQMNLESKTENIEPPHI